MADVPQKEEQLEHGTRSTNDSDPQQLIFTKPTGFKGLYYHPRTQVRSVLRAPPPQLISTKVAMLGFVCFMCPGMLSPIQVFLFI
jgi:hypothetical protein